jgi:cobalamin biosynthesis protein CobW
MTGVQCLVVSGFLGSGKTTLVRRLLDHAQQQGLRLAVISNEFGELGIDAALLGGAGEDYVELPGGCVCCQLSDELVATLQTLRERVQPDRIVIETSGVALPYDTQLNLAREPVSTWVGDDVALVVVNAEQLAAEREIEGVFVDQVSSADLLLLHKVDLVPARALDALEARLADWAPGTPVLRAEHGDIDPALLFAPGPGSLSERRPQPGHRHSEFTAESLEIPPGLSESELLARLERLDALRIKGFVETQVGLRLVQAVGPRIELSEVAERPAPELVGRLVAIRRAR